MKITSVSIVMHNEDIETLTKAIESFLSLEIEKETHHH